MQQQIASNRQGQRTRSNAKAASLLAGLVFDERGDRLTPTHATKGQKRYRYYIGPEGEDTLRIPAQELEKAVMQGLTGFLQDEGRVLDAIEATEAQAIQTALRQAKAAAADLNQASTRIETMQRLVDRITVSTDNLRISIKANTIGAMAEAIIDQPVQLKRCGMAMRLIVRNGQTPSAPQVDAKLVGLISKAQQWFADLASGRCSGVAEIADQAQVSTSYVTRVMHLAFLAPDIVEQIASGEAPPELTAERLARMGPLPMEWTAQRELLGIG